MIVHYYTRQNGVSITVKAVRAQNSQEFRQLQPRLLEFPPSSRRIRNDVP